MPALPTTYIVNREPINKNEIRRFLTALDPTAKDFLFVAIKSHSKPQVTRQPLTDQVLDSFDHWNSQNYNIFFTVNQTLGGQGLSRENKDVTKFRCIYADDDAKQVPNPYPIPPSAVIESSPGKKQVYWFIDDCSGIDEWNGVQQTLVNYYAGDKEARDAARRQGIDQATQVEVEPDLSERAAHAFAAGRGKRSDLTRHDARRRRTPQTISGS